MFTVLVEDTLIEALETVYESPIEEVNTPLFNLLGQGIVGIIQLGKSDSLLMRNIEAGTQFDRFMDALAQLLAGC